ncbi:MAG TPA: TetR/AcrR family transcriptional regulator [Alphaproteobacteria bacterium]|nr:TetR/AcrR family transcriptional regulator [Alphaproteobacteria bacterium]
MARSKAFDPDVALRKAMQLFWRQGYEATSVDDLVHAMGVNRASLYATFGDKRTLFRLALERYIATVLAPRLDASESTTSALAGLRRLLGELVAFAAGDPQRRGCLAVNAACELAGRDPDVTALLKVQAETLEARLARVIARAQANGELPRGRDPTALARLLASVIDGLRVRSKLAPDRAALESIAETAMAALG